MIPKELPGFAISHININLGKNTWILLNFWCVDVGKTIGGNAILTETCFVVIRKGEGIYFLRITETNYEESNVVF